MALLDHAHSILRWILLLLLIRTLWVSWSGMRASAPFTKAHQQGSLWLMIAADLQLMLGLILYFVSPLGLKNIQNQGMGVVMKDSLARFFAIEHITMMILAIIFIHIGRALSKKAEQDTAKHRALFRFTLLALVLILIAIPWPFRDMFSYMSWF